LIVLECNHSLAVLAKQILNLLGSTIAEPNPNKLRVGLIFENVPRTEVLVFNLISGRPGLGLNRSQD